MQALVINNHSFIDLITNSSTELFVCGVKKSVTAVEELLKIKWKYFAELYEHNPDPEYLFNEVLYVYAIENEEQLNELKQELFYYTKYVRPQVGNIIIKGQGDNSIPYEFFDVIKTFFNACSVHLG